MEYYDHYTIDNDSKKSYRSFDYSHSTNMRAAEAMNTSRPCILRRQPQQSNLGAIPDLTGPVQIVNEHNAVVLVVNVSGILGRWGHSHPHDAQILANGDLIVATWNPGRVSYWKRVKKGDTEEANN